MTQSPTLRHSSPEERSARAERSDAHRRLVISASAGTGKTFQLSSRYISLLRRTRPERILASTFTRKAAGEIQERILLRLARAIVDPEARKELSRSVGPPELTRNECLALLSELTRSLHRLRICTLDAFFSQLASCYALELGLPPGWRILDPIEIAQLKSDAIEAMLRDGAPQDTVQLMHMLDKGRNSQSVSRLIRETIGSSYHLFVSTSRECWERFPSTHGQLLSDDAIQGVVDLLQQTSLSARMAGRRDKDCAALAEQDWTFLTKGLAAKIISGENKYYGKPIPDNACQLYEQLIAHYRALKLEIWKQQTSAAWQVLSDFHQAYAQFKFVAGGLEFDDITRRLTEISPESVDVLSHAFRLDAAIDHLLLDEFQDTSRDQWLAIRRFAEQACLSPDGSFFCVGDTKQAIYGWRGGEAAIFETIDEQLPQLSKQCLQKSFRSSPVVMDAVNQSMTQLSRHDNFDDHAELLQKWSRNFPEHVTEKQDLPGYVRLGIFPASEQESSDRPKFDAEAAWKYTAEYVAELTLQAPGASIGVLTRKNDVVGRLIYELGQLEVEASEEGGNPLTDSAAVQLVLSLMKLADHPGNTVARYHVARSPLGSCLSFTDPHDDRLAHQFSLQLRAQLLEEGISGIVNRLLAQLAPSCDRREYRRLTQLAALADRYDRLFPTLRATDFVGFIEQQKEQEPTNAAVRVMTLHQAKGLEFDIVILPELHSPVAQLRNSTFLTLSDFPGGPTSLVATFQSQDIVELAGGDLLQAQAQTKGRSLQETLCLLYVGMTRAVHSLHMLIPALTGKTHPRTIAGLLAAGLGDGPADEDGTLYEHGDPQWYQQVPSVLRSRPREPERPPVQIQFAAPDMNRGLRRSTPSGRKAARPLPLQALTNSSGHRARQRGTVIHRWLQEVDWLEDGTPDESQLRALVSDTGISETDLAVWIEDWKQLLEHTTVRRLLSRGPFLADLLPSLPEEVQPELQSGDLQTEVRTEYPFSRCLPEGGLVRGTVDRLVVVSKAGRPCAADIIDYKTDAATDAQAVSERAKFYREQMSAYREAVAAMFHLPTECVRVRLLFLQNGQLCSGVEPG